MTGIAEYKGRASHDLAVVERDHSLSAIVDHRDRTELLNSVNNRHESTCVDGRLTDFVFGVKRDLHRLTVGGRMPHTSEIWTVLTRGDRSTTLGIGLILISLLVLALSPRKV